MSHTNSHEGVKTSQTVVFAVGAMIAFAANSLLARLAFTETQIDPASFSVIRLISGAMVLGLFVLARFRTAIPKEGSWSAAVALSIYGFAFSFAYVQLPAGTGALVLFGAVQLSMLVYGFSKGDRFSALQWVGFLLACFAVAFLVSPGVSAPAPFGVILMTSAGVGWACYTILGRSGDPARLSAGNFLRTVPICLMVCLFHFPDADLDSLGVVYAVLSGGITSGLGYLIWYQVLPYLSVLKAGVIQLSVPVIAAGMGVLLLDEEVTFRLFLVTAGILVGIAIVLVGSRPR